MNDLSFGKRHGPRSVPAWDRLDARGINKPEPLPEQTPRRFCVILLKGMQTRWADNPAQLRAITSALNADAHLHLVYEYVAVFGRYSQVMDAAMVPCSPS
jgi:hypothetical protein